MTLAQYAKGSARPEGGREAPAVEPKVRLRRNGAGSGAARPCPPGGTAKQRAFSRPQAKRYPVCFAHAEAPDRGPRRSGSLLRTKRPTAHRVPGLTRDLWLNGEAPGQARSSGAHR